MTASTLKEALPATCEVVLPDRTAGAQSALPKRWWQARGCSVPAAIITPSSEDDVVAAVRAAAERGLKIVPAGGQAGANVTVDEHTIYMDLCRLDSFSIDPARETLTVGGGTRWREVTPSLVAAGFAASWPGFDGVGVAGHALGGGIGPMASFTGLAADQILGARVVVAPGKVVELSEGDADEDRTRLLNQLRGGGQGLCAVTSLTLRIRKISSLGLDGESTPHIPSCSAMFLESAWEYAAALTAGELAKTDPRLGVHMVVMAAPPNLPPGVAGTPAVMLALTYIGNEDVAAGAFSALLAAETREKAVFVVQGSSAVGDNTQAGRIFADKDSGNRMDMFNALVGTMSKDAILRHMRLYLEFREAAGADMAAKTFCVMAGFGGEKLQRFDRDGKTGFCRRDRSVMVQFLLWGVDSDENLELGRRHALRVLDNARFEDRTAGVEDAVFANNARVGVGAREAYTVDGLQRLERVKKLWDPSNIFIHPFFE